MPWVRLDDRFPTHRKVALLSDRAFRLYVSALCWASENLTEGHVPDENLTRIAHVRNTKAAATELEGRGLWERVDDGWMIHDFLEYNPDRAKIKAGREANAARQQAYRDRKKAEQDAKRAAAKIERNAVTPPSRNASRNGGSNATPNPSPSPEVPPTEVPTDWAALIDDDIPVIGTGPRIPPNARPLVTAITQAGMVVGWDLVSTDWFVIEALLKRCGPQALVDDARKSWAGAREPVRSAKYFIPAWRKLPDIPEETRNLPAVVNGPQLPRSVSRQQQETDDWFEASMARAQAKDAAAQQMREPS